jgi:hypothetical protein
MQKNMEIKKEFKMNLKTKKCLLTSINIFYLKNLNNYIIDRIVIYINCYVL